MRELAVSQTALAFAADRAVIRALQPILDIGLDYGKLFQPAPRP